MAKRYTNRRGRGLLGNASNRALSVAWTPDALYRQADRCGSGNFFSKSTRRFFNSRVTRTYPNEDRGVTYFVEAFGGGNTPVARKYRVGLLKNCKIQILGKGSAGLKKGYDSSAQANRVAERMAYPGKRKNPRRRRAARK